MDHQQVLSTQIRPPAESISAPEAKPVWLRIPNAVLLFSIGRSKMYELIAKQEIESRLIKSRRDAKRGIKLVSYDSLNKFITGAGEQEGGHAQ